MYLYVWCVRERSNLPVPPPSQIHTHVFIFIYAWCVREHSTPLGLPLYCCLRVGRKCIIFNIWMHYVTQINASYQINECVASHIWMSPVTSMNECMCEKALKPASPPPSDTYTSMYTLNGTILYMWHDSLMCAMTHSSSAQTHSPSPLTHTRPCTPATWHIHMCDMTHWSTWHDSFIERSNPLALPSHAYTLMYMYNMTHSYVWHDSLICDMTHSSSAQTHSSPPLTHTHSCTVIWQIYICEMTRWSARHDSFIVRSNTLALPLSHIHIHAHV